MPEYEKQTTESLHKAIYQNKSHTRFYRMTKKCESKKILKYLPVYMFPYTMKRRTYLFSIFTRYISEGCAGIIDVSKTF
jgi:hypothetical protein